MIENSNSPIFKSKSHQVLYKYLVPMPMGGGLFSFFEDKSASKVLKVGVFCILFRLMEGSYSPPAPCYATCLVRMIDADVTSGESRWPGLLLLKPGKNKKNLQYIKFIAITGVRSISCPDLTVKYLEGMGMLGCGGNKHLLQNYLVL